MNCKCLFLIMAMLLSSSIMKAQSPLEPGELQINFGMGLADLGTSLYGGLDLGTWDNITIGGLGAFSNDYLSIGGNMNYHFDELFNLPPEWNVYAGVSLGVIKTDKDLDNDGFGIGGQLGGRYFFNDRWGINLELGGGNLVSGGRIGMTLATF